VCTENSEANRVRKKHNRAIIAADVRRFCHQIKRTKFSAHTHLAEIDATHRLLAHAAIAAFSRDCSWLVARREARWIVIDAAIFVFGAKYASYPRVSRGVAMLARAALPSGRPP
jgi:hypothetical protein